MTWRRKYRCPSCRAVWDEWSYGCPCRQCGHDNKERELIKLVGRWVWNPTWRNWFRQTLVIKEQ